MRCEVEGEEDGVELHGLWFWFWFFAMAELSLGVWKTTPFPFMMVTVEEGIHKKKSREPAIEMSVLASWFVPSQHLPSIHPAYLLYYPTLPVWGFQAFFCFSPFDG